jgi:hypothetical protein
MTTDKLDIKKKSFLEALSKSLGIISTACGKNGISRQTFYTWRNADPVFAQACQEVEENAIDFVESKLLELIAEKNPAACIFFCKTKGKSRGYIERNEFSGKDGGPIQIEQLTESETSVLARIKHNIIEEHKALEVS